MKTFLLIPALAFLLAGCSSMPLRPGRASVVTDTGKVLEVRQSQNPLNETVQDYKRVTDPETKVTTEEVHTKIGAAQKDTAREIGAKLGSLKSVVWVGILVFLFGVASFVYPPLKLIVGGSVTTSAVITGAGLALIVLPSLLVGHELLILAVAGGAAALYFFAHRHGGVHAELKTLKGALVKELNTPPGA